LTNESERYKKARFLHAPDSITYVYECNRLSAVSDNGYVSSFLYDASGERTVKLTGDGEGMTVNGRLSGGRTGTDGFTAYVSLSCRLPFETFT